MKSHLLTYSQATTPVQVQHMLNESGAIETWVAPFPYAAILVSKLDVHDIAAILHSRLPGVWFMVTELDAAAVQGWLPRDLWEYVNDPQGAWSRKLFAGLAPFSTEPPPPPQRTMADLIRGDARK